MKAKKRSTKNTPTKTPDQEKLDRWRSEFQLDWRVHAVWLEKKREWERFYDGDQLSTEEKTALAARRQPEVVINRIKPRIDGAIGDFLGRRVMMRARDRGSLDFDKAKHITESLRYVEDQTRFDESESMGAKDVLVGGVTWYKAAIEFDFMEPEIRVYHRENEDIVVDRRCRKRNLSDAKRLWETVWVEEEDLIEMFPQHEEQIRQATQMHAESFKETFGGPQSLVKSNVGDQYAIGEEVSPDTNLDFDTFVDPGRRRLRLIHVWERVQKRTEFAFHPDLKSTVKDVSDLTAEEMANFKAAFPKAQYFARPRWELNSGLFIANHILEDKENVRPHDSEGKFPFARAIGHVEHGDLKIPYGMVKQYISPQEEYNKRRSKLLHKLNTNRVLAEEGAFANNDIERTRTEAARPDGVLIYKAGKNLVIDKDKIEQADIFMLQLAQNEIEDSGISSEFIGQENKQMSGTAINLRQMGGLKMMRPFYEALRAARRDIFTIVLEEIQQYWTSEKLIKITDDPEAGTIVLNQRTTDENGNPVIVNNLRLGKYDIKIDEDLETPNQRKEIFDSLIQLGQVALSGGEAFPLEMLIKASDLPNKQEWIDAITARRQQQMQMLQMQALSKAGAVPPNGQNRDAGGTGG